MSLSYEEYKQRMFKSVVNEKEVYVCINPLIDGKILYFLFNQDTIYKLDSFYISNNGEKITKNFSTKILIDGKEETDTSKVIYFGNNINSMIMNFKNYISVELDQEYKPEYNDLRLYIKKIIFCNNDIRILKNDEIKSTADISTSNLLPLDISTSNLLPTVTSNIDSL